MQKKQPNQTPATITVNRLYTCYIISIHSRPVPRCSRFLHWPIQRFRAGFDDRRGRVENEIEAGVGTITSSHVKRFE